MAKVKIIYSCQSCGYQSPKWLGRCPDCHQWNSLDEERRVLSGIGEFDRVLGGGLVQGSVILIGGDPGIGKSTLLLQAFAAISQRDLTCLYVSGEESPRQIKMRAERLGISLIHISEPT